MHRNIILIGFMGTGKTTVGRQLAEEMGRSFLDLDHLIEEHAGMSISDIFEHKGEEYFRKLESQILENVVRSINHVIATGGGIVLNPANIAVMKENAVVVALTAETETLWERLKDSADRPLLKGKNPKERLLQLYEQRSGLYKNADFTVHVDGKTPAAITKEIIQLLNYIKLYQKGSVSYR